MTRAVHTTVLDLASNVTRRNRDSGSNSPAAYRCTCTRVITRSSTNPALHCHDDDVQSSDRTRFPLKTPSGNPTGAQNFPLRFITTTATAPERIARRVLILTPARFPHWRSSSTNGIYLSPLIHARTILRFGTSQPSFGSPGSSWPPPVATEISHRSLSRVHVLRVTRRKTRDEPVSNGNGFRGTFVRRVKPVARPVVCMCDVRTVTIVKFQFQSAYARASISSAERLEEPYFLCQTHKPVIDVGISNFKAPMLVLRFPLRDGWKGPIFYDSLRRYLTEIELFRSNDRIELGLKFWGRI